MSRLYQAHWTFACKKLISTGKRLGLVAVLVILLPTCALAQFTSIADGPWNDGATWGNASPGTAGTDYPNASQSAVIGSNVHVLNGTVASVGDISVTAGYVLTIDQGGTLNLNGAMSLEDDGLGGIGLADVNGILSANDGSSFINDSETTISFNSTGIYQHNFTTTPGAIVQAAWTSGSDCQIVGYTTNTTLPTNIDQSFYNFTWSCANFTGSPASNTAFFALTGKPSHINGNFKISRTGNSTTAHARTLRLFDNLGSLTMSIDGDLIVENAARMVLSTTGFNNSLVIGGSLRINSTPVSGGTAVHTFATTGFVTVNITSDFLMAPTGTTSVALQSTAEAIGSAPVVVTVNGNFSMAPTGGTTTLNMGSVSGAGSALSVKGFFNMNASSTITRSAGSPTVAATINFNGTGTQVYSNAGTNNIANAINYNIAAGSKVDMGTSVFSGTGSFTTASNVNTAIFVGSTDANGAIQNLTTAGNIRTPVATRTYGALSKIIYKNTVAQFMGDGQPGANFTEIQNPAGVTMVADQTFSNNLTLTSGSLTIGDGITLRTLTLSNNFVGNSNSLGVNSQSDLVISGSGSISAINFSGTTIEDLTINHAAGFTLGSNLDVSGVLTLTSGNLTISNGVTPAQLTLSGTFTPNANFLAINSQSSLAINGTGAFGAIPFSGTTLNNFTINRTSLGSASLGTDLVVGGTLTQTAGDIILNGHSLTINGYSYVAGNFIIDNLASMVINGTGSFGTLNTTGSAAPASLLNLTLNRTSSGSITLGGDLQVVGTLTHTAGDIVMNGKTLTIYGYSRTAGTFAVDPNASFVINGTGLFGSLVLSGGTTINNFLVNRSSGLVGLGSDLTVNGGFILQDGNVAITGRTLTAKGPFLSNGNLVVNSGSKLVITNTNGGGIFYPPTGVSFIGSAMNTIYMDRNDTFMTTSNLTLDSLNLVNGIFDNQGSMVITAGGEINRDNGSIVNNAGGTIAGASSYDVNYNQTANSYASGPELPLSTTELRNLYKSGNHTLTLSQDITINGNLTLDAVGGSVFDAGTHAIDLKGNLVSGSTSTLTSSALTFSGTTAISGSSPLRFGAVTITGAVTTTSNLEFDGNLTNNGTLSSGTTTTIFGGTTAITGSGTTAVNNVILASPATLSGNLSVSGNWTNNSSVSAYTTGTVTFNGTSTTGLGAFSTSFNNIVITGTLNAPAVFTLRGNFLNNGTFNRGTGTIVFAGSSVQSILSSNSTVTDFNNISITNTAGPPAVRVQTSQNLRGILTLAANSIFDADGVTNNAVFTLKSLADDPTADAMIAALPSGAAVQGSVSVERYISLEGTNNRIYRYISSPVKKVPVSQIQAYIPVTGSFTGTSSCQGCTTTPSMFHYDETVITDSDGSGIADLNDGYVAFPSSSSSDTLKAGRGYAIFVRGNIAPISTAGSAKFTVRAPINSGIINFNAFTTYTGSTNNANDGWNLVGNPYPCTIDWESTGWTKTGLNNSIYMRDNSFASPVYASYIGGVGTNGGSQYLPIGQAFFVKSDGGPVDFRANETVKFAGLQSTYIREAAPSNVLRLALEKGEVRDETVIRFKDEATAGFDKNWDAYKLSNPSPTFNFFSKTEGGTPLAINAMSGLGCSEVQLVVANVVPGEYHIGAGGFESFDSTVQTRLIDSFLGQSVTLSSAGYNFSVTTDSASFGNRFILSFSTAPIKTDLMATAQHACATANAAVSITQSQAGVTYYASISGHKVSDVLFGNGGDLSIPIANSNLENGENTVHIMAASSGCVAIPFNNSITVKKDGLYTASASGGSHCQQGEVVLTASGAPTEGGYHWYETQDATLPIAGQEGAQFVTPELTKTKTYFVAAVNSIGCEGERKAAVATIVNFDNASITIVDDKTLRSNYASGNRWFLDGLLLSDTSMTLSMKVSGTYTLEVKVGTCTTSDEKIMVVTGLGEVPVGFKSYPNPVSGVYQLELPADQADGDELPIFNTLGTRIGVMKLAADGSMKKGQFDFSSHSAGFYYLRAVFQNRITVIKVIKN